MNTYDLTYKNDTREGTKYCPLCGKEVPKTEFLIVRGSPDGCYTICRNHRQELIKVYELNSEPTPDIDEYNNSGIGAGRPKKKGVNINRVNDRHYNILNYLRKELPISISADEIAKETDEYISYVHQALRLLKERGFIRYDRYRARSLIGVRFYWILFFNITITEKGFKYNHYEREDLGHGCQRNIRRGTESTFADNNRNRNCTNNILHCGSELDSINFSGQDAAKQST